MKSIDKKNEIVIDNEFMKFTFASHVRGFHFYQTVWSPIIGKEDLEYRPEKENEEDDFVIGVTAMICMICREKPWSDIFHGIYLNSYKFLQLPISKLYCRVTGNTLSKGVGYGLKIPITCALSGHGKVIECMKSKIYEDLKVNENLKNRCLK